MNSPITTDCADSRGLLTTNWHELPRNGHRRHREKEVSGYQEGEPGGNWAGGAGSVKREAGSGKREAGSVERDREKKRDSHHKAIILCRRHLGSGCGTLAASLRGAQERGNLTSSFDILNSVF